METHARVEASDAIFEGRVFAVKRDRVVLPKGRSVTLDIVRHPASVILVPQPDPDHVVLIRQYRYAIDRWIWELPAGSLDPGEAVLEGARRECAEEIGLLPASIEPLGAWYPTPGFCDELMHFLRLTGLRKVTPEDGPIELDEDEDLSVKVFTLGEARDLVARGEIVDLKTAWGLALL